MDVPFASLQLGGLLPDCGIRPDWTGRLRVPTGERLLILDARKSGQPRMPGYAANQLLRYAETIPKAVLIFAAPYISSDAADILNREGINYIDLAGNCRLVFDTVYIRRQDWPNRSAKCRGSAFALLTQSGAGSPACSLQEPKRQWKVQALADAASVSLGQVSNVKRLLEDREWLSREGEGVVLSQPAKLLQEWSQTYRFSRSTGRDFYTLDSPAQVEAKLAKACLASKTDYALTGFSAAARLR